jgi:hypothetical protein
MSAKWVVAVLLFYAIMSAAQSSTVDCDILYSTGVSAEDCIMGGAMNFVEFTPASDMTLQRVDVVGSWAQVTLSNDVGEISRTSPTGALDKPVTLAAGEKYYLTIYTSGCPKASSMPSQSGTGVWKVITSKCKTPHCNVAVELVAAGCDTVSGEHAQPGTIGYAINKGIEGGGRYLIPGLVILALLTITFHFGRGAEHENIAGQIPGSDKVQVEKSPLRRFTFKKRGEGL